MHELKYCPANPDDLDQIIALSVNAYKEFQAVMTPEHWEVFSAGIQNRQKVSELIKISQCCICMDGKEIVGVAYFVPSGNPSNLYPAEWSYIRMVGVHPEYRGLGVAKKLMESCIDFARQGNEMILALHTSEYMDAARHIYQNLGFNIYKEIPGGLYGMQYWIYTMELRKPDRRPPYSDQPES